MSRQAPTTTIDEGAAAPIQTAAAEPARRIVRHMISITKSRLARLASASALIATMAVATVPAAAMAAGPVFQNGNLETGNYVPTFAGQDYERLGTGSTAMSGWTVTKGNVDWTASGILQAADGSKSVDLDGAENTAGAISQTFDTVVNGTYVVTFDMSGNPGNPDVSPIKTMTVGAAGASSAYSYNTDTNGTTFAAMHWAGQTFTFQAKSTQTTLTFTSTTGSGWGPALDNVSITQTLATGASCKNSGWKSMVDSAGTSFRNQGDCVSFYATGERNLAN